MSKHNFKASLEKGNAGELELLRLFPALTKLDGRHGDLMIGEQKVELKTDYYEHKDGGNFFIERYSDMNVLSPGGPWQAKAHGCEYFVYYFLNSNIAYVWNTEALIGELEMTISTLVPVEIKNVRWVTLGYKVPRSMLKAQLIFVTNNKKATFLHGDKELFQRFVK